MSKVSVSANDRTTLKVKVIEARGVRAADSHLIGSDSSDPYVKVFIRKQDRGNYHKTNVIKKTLNPVWGESFVLYPSNEQLICDALHFEVYDKDKGSADDLLGIVKLSIAHFANPDNNDRDEWYTIWDKDTSKDSVTGRKPGKGQLRLRIKLTIKD